QLHADGQRGVELLERCGEPCIPAAQVVLARVVRAVREPEADELRAELLGDRDALEAVVEGLPADARVWIADAAEPVLVLAEQVRVDRADADPALLCVPPKRAPVVDAIPGDVEGHARTTAGEAVHERRVVDPLPGGAGRAGPRKHVEARARVPVSPGGRLDLQCGKAIEVHPRESDASATELRICFRFFQFRKSTRQY